MRSELLSSLKLTALFMFVAAGLAIHKIVYIKNSNELPPLVFVCIFGRHVCNYSVNTELRSVLFSFFPPSLLLVHMELCHPVIAYFALENYRVGNSLMPAFSHAHTCPCTHTLPCVLLCYSQLWL